MGSYGLLVMRGALIAAGIAVLMSACSVPRPRSTPGLSCRIGEVLTPLDIDLAPRAVAFDGGHAGDVELVDGAAAFYDAALARVAATRGTSHTFSERSGNQPIRQLVLSGGGQEGAFGSGFLKGANGRVDYDIVTGVSTGALQAIFALLGTTQYVRPPFSGDFPLRRPDATALDDLVSGYSITTAKSLYANRGEIAIVTKAAQGSLEPLRLRVRELLPPGVFEALLKKRDAGAQLFVALLDWDSGRAGIVDMMKLADLHRGNAIMQRDCFADVLVAASSEPLATAPVNIDGTLYMDAGLRFGVFGKAMVDAGDRLAQRAAAQNALSGGVALAAVQTDVIVNGVLADLKPESLPEKYSALDLMGQGRHILALQIYRFSVSDVMRHGPGHTTRLVYIDGKSLPKVDRPKSLMFNPAYMARLISEGEARGKIGDWSLVCDAGAQCRANAPRPKAR